MPFLSFDQSSWLAGWQQAALLGAWFGLLHAFDPDHLATIGGLAVNNRSLSPAGYALRWAFGHGAALCVIAMLVLGLDLAGVIEWTSYGDVLVCLALWLIGAQALRAVWLRRRGAHVADTTLAVHAHSHGRWHLHFVAPFHTHASARTRSGRRSVLMGVIHGGAGSAAVLALLPLARVHDAVDGALYLFCFSIGVALGALAFANVFAFAARRALATGERLTAGFQAAVGVLALTSGLWLFLEILHGGA